MSNPVLKRGLLTDTLVDYLTGQLTTLHSPILVGDGIAPVKGGWAGGQPGSGAFVPYVVVTAGGATHRGSDDLGAGTLWDCTYTLNGVGATRSQMDYVVDSCRPPIMALYHALDVAGPDWSIVQVYYTALGGTRRSDATGLNATYEATDSLTLTVGATRR